MNDKWDNWPRLWYLVALIVLLCMGLSACETYIIADTPCGRVEYYSTKGQMEPQAICRVNPDGTAEMIMGSKGTDQGSEYFRAAIEALLKAVVGLKG